MTYSKIADIPQSRVDDYKKNLSDVIGNMKFMEKMLVNPFEGTGNQLPNSAKNWPYQNTVAVGTTVFEATSDAGVLIPAGMLGSSFYAVWYPYDSSSRTFGTPLFLPFSINAEEINQIARVICWYCSLQAATISTTNVGFAGFTSAVQIDNSPALCSGTSMNPKDIYNYANAPSLTGNPNQRAIGIPAWNGSFVCQASDATVPWVRLLDSTPYQETDTGYAANGFATAVDSEQSYSVDADLVQDQDVLQILVDSDGWIPFEDYLVDGIKGGRIDWTFKLNETAAVGLFPTLVTTNAAYSFNLGVRFTLLGITGETIKTVYCHQEIVFWPTQTGFAANLVRSGSTPLFLNCDPNNPDAFVRAVRFEYFLASTTTTTTGGSTLTDLNFTQAINPEIMYSVNIANAHITGLLQRAYMIFVSGLITGTSISANCQLTMETILDPTETKYFKPTERYVDFILEEATEMVLSAPSDYGVKFVGDLLHKDAMSSLFRSAVSAEYYARSKQWGDCADSCFGAINAIGKYPALVKNNSNGDRPIGDFRGFMSNLGKSLKKVSKNVGSQVFEPVYKETLQSFKKMPAEMVRKTLMNGLLALAADRIPNDFSSYQPPSGIQYTPTPSSQNQPMPVASTKLTPSARRLVNGLRAMGCVKKPINTLINKQEYNPYFEQVDEFLGTGQFQVSPITKEKVIITHSKALTKEEYPKRIRIAAGGNLVEIAGRVSDLPENLQEEAKKHFGVDDDNTYKVVMNYPSPASSVLHSEPLKEGEYIKKVRFSNGGPVIEILCNINDLPIEDQEEQRILLNMERKVGTFDDIVSLAVERLKGKPATDQKDNEKYLYKQKEVEEEDKGEFHDFHCIQPEGAVPIACTRRLSKAFDSLDIGSYDPDYKPEEKKSKIQKFEYDDPLGFETPSSAEFICVRADTNLISKIKVYPSAKIHKKNDRKISRPENNLPPRIKRFHPMDKSFTTADQKELGINANECEVPISECSMFPIIWLHEEVDKQGFPKIMLVTEDGSAAAPFAVVPTKYLPPGFLKGASCFSVRGGKGMVYNYTKYDNEPTLDLSPHEDVALLMCKGWYEDKLVVFSPTVPVGGRSMEVAIWANNNGIGGLILFTGLVEAGKIDAMDMGVAIMKKKLARMNFIPIVGYSPYDDSDAKFNISEHELSHLLTRLTQIRPVIPNKKFVAAMDSSFDPIAITHDQDIPIPKKLTRLLSCVDWAYWHIMPSDSDPKKHKIVCCLTEISPLPINPKWQVQTLNGVLFASHELNFSLFYEANLVLSRKVLALLNVEKPFSAVIPYSDGFKWEHSYPIAATHRCETLDEIIARHDAPQEDFGIFSFPIFKIENVSETAKNTFNQANTVNSCMEYTVDIDQSEATKFKHWLRWKSEGPPRDGTSIGVFHAFREEFNHLKKYMNINTTFLGMDIQQGRNYFANKPPAVRPALSLKWGTDFIMPPKNEQKNYDSSSVIPLTFGDLYSLAPGYFSESFSKSLLSKRRLGSIIVTMPGKNYIGHIVTSSPPSLDSLWLVPTAISMSYLSETQVQRVNKENISFLMPMHIMLLDVHSAKPLQKVYKQASSSKNLMVDDDLTRRFSEFVIETYKKNGLPPADKIREMFEKSLETKNYVDDDSFEFVESIPTSVLANKNNTQGFYPSAATKMSKQKQRQSIIAALEALDLGEDRDRSMTPVSVPMMHPAAWSTFPAAWNQFATPMPLVQNVPSASLGVKSSKDRELIKYIMQNGEKLLSDDLSGNKLNRVLNGVKKGVNSGSNPDVDVLIQKVKTPTPKSAAKSKAKSSPKAKAKSVPPVETTQKKKVESNIIKILNWDKTIWTNASPLMKAIHLIAPYVPYEKVQSLSLLGDAHQNECLNYIDDIVSSKGNYVTVPLNLFEFSGALMSAILLPFSSPLPPQGFVPQIDFTPTISTLTNQLFKEEPQVEEGETPNG